MPWPKKQAIAIMLKAQRKGDKGLEEKAKSYLKGGGMGDRMASRARPKPKY